MILNNREINVVVTRKKIKNIYFRIDDNTGDLQVSCPRLCSDREITKLLKDNAKSLEKMYKKYDRKSKEKQKVLYLGDELDFIQYKKIMIDEPYAYGPSIEKINEYLEKNSLSIFQERLDLYINEFDNIPKFRLRVRNMKTRWGVCNRRSMTVTLNTQLIHKNTFLIDYVIVHELSHFSHMDHSKAFWREVERHYPDYKEARKELNY